MVVEEEVVKRNMSEPEDRTTMEGDWRRGK